MLSLHDVPGLHIDSVTLAPVAKAATVLVPLWRAPFNCTVYDVSFAFSSAVTGNATDRFNLNLVDHTGASTAELGNVDFSAGANGTPSTEISIYSSTAGTALLKDTWLGVQVESIGAGLAMPGAAFAIEYKGR